MPLVGLSNAEIMFNNVDLPEPDLPYKIAISPRLILKDIPFNQIRNNLKTVELRLNDEKRKDDN